MIGVPQPCSATAAMNVLGRRWAVTVLRDLFHGRHRFGAIAEASGAPRDVLTARLRELEAAGLIRREQYSERPPRFEYHLTEAGQDFFPVLVMLTQWGDRWAWPERPAKPPVTFHHHPAGAHADGDGHVLLAGLMCGVCRGAVRGADLTAVAAADAVLDTS